MTALPPLPRACQNLWLDCAGQQQGARAASGQDASTSGQSVALASQELPYTIAAPESYEEFASLVAGRSAADLSAAIQRIIACNSAALASGNRRRLQVKTAPKIIGNDVESLATPPALCKQASWPVYLVWNAQPAGERPFCVNLSYVLQSQFAVSD